MVRASDPALHVERGGDGPDIVLLHGWGMNGAVWGPLVEPLRASFRVHSVDLPGHGYSPPCVRYDLDDLASRLRRVLPARATLCGWSLGGILAAWCALRFPTVVERLVLVAATPCFVRRPDWTHGMAQSDFEDFRSAVARDNARAMERFVALMTRDEPREVARALRHQLNSRPAAGVEAQLSTLHLLASTDLRAELPLIAQPVLWVSGEKDIVVPPAAVAAAARLTPCGRLLSVSGAGHAPFISSPGPIARGIAEFCGGN